MRGWWEGGGRGEGFEKGRSGGVWGGGLRELMYTAGKLGLGLLTEKHRVGRVCLAS